MSTRATYEMDGHTFYIHHDGYPSGAAQYFSNAVNYKCAAPNATLADCFIRANERAELTGSHDTHGDTDYQYTITNRPDGRKQITVKRRRWSSGECAETITNVLLSNFILNQLEQAKAA